MTSEPDPPNSRSPPDPPVIAGVKKLQHALSEYKIGAYRLLKTGQIWQIKLENGKLKLTDHLLATHDLRPLSATRFDPDGPFYASILRCGH